MQYPRGLNPERVSQGGASSRFQALVLLLYPLALLPVLLAYLARYAFDSTTVFYWMLGLAAIIGAVVYWISMESAVSTALLHRERIIHDLSAAEGPVVWEEVQVGKPGPGEVRIRHTAVGLNFVDIYNRSGLYPLALPSGLGGEAAGVVEEVGSGVTDLKAGDRICYGAVPIGSYAEARLIPADRLLKLPDGIDDKTAAAMMLKGLTTQVPRRLSRSRPASTICLHAAAGGGVGDPRPVGKTSRGAP